MTSGPGITSTRATAEPIGPTALRAGASARRRPLEEFDAVVIANGHLTEPIMPELPALHGQVPYAHDYRSDADFEAERPRSGWATPAATSRSTPTRPPHHGIVIRRGAFQPKTLRAAGAPSAGRFCRRCASG